MDRELKRMQIIAGRQRAKKKREQSTWEQLTSHKRGEEKKKEERQMQLRRQEAPCFVVPISLSVGGQGHKITLRWHIKEMHQVQRRRKQIGPNYHLLFSVFEVFIA